MKKLLLISFLALGAMLNFSSCGKDDPAPPNLDENDPAMLRTNYTGTVHVHILNNNKADTIISTNMNLKAGTSSNVLYMTTNEFDFIDRGGQVSNFKYTSTSKEVLKFTMGGFTKEFGTNSIPGYFKKWYTPSPWDKINKITLVLDNTDGSYTLKTKELKFKYTGKATVNYTVTANNLTKDEVLDIVYEYTVNN